MKVYCYIVLLHSLDDFLIVEYVNNYNSTMGTTKLLILETHHGNNNSPTKNSNHNDNLNVNVSEEH